MKAENPSQIFFLEDKSSSPYKDLRRTVNNDIPLKFSSPPTSVADATFCLDDQENMIAV